MAKRRTLGDTIARQAHQIEGLKRDNQRFEDENAKLRAQIDALRVVIMDISTRIPETLARVANSPDTERR